MEFEFDDELAADIHDFDDPEESVILGDAELIVFYPSQCQDHSLIYPDPMTTSERES